MVCADHTSRSRRAGVHQSASHPALRGNQRRRRAIKGVGENDVVQPEHTVAARDRNPDRGRDPRPSRGANPGPGWSWRRAFAPGPLAGCHPPSASPGWATGRSAPCPDSAASRPHGRPAAGSTAGRTAAGCRCAPRTSASACGAAGTSAGSQPWLRRRPGSGGDRAGTGCALCARQGRGARLWWAVLSRPGRLGGGPMAARGS